MALGDRVGGVYYEVEARNEVERGLRDAEGDIRQFQRRVEAMEAAIEVGADLKELNADFAKVKAWKESLEADKIEVELALDDKGFHKDIKDVDRYLDTLDRSIKRATADMKRLNAERGPKTQELNALQRQIKAYEKLDTATRKSIATQEKANQTDLKRIATLAQLRRKAAELYTEMQKADRQDMFRTTAREALQLQAVQAELDHTRQRIVELGGSTDDLNVDLDRSEGALRRWGRQFLSTRIHLGVLSTSVGGLGRVIVGLAPLVMGAIGVLSSLVGVLGTSLVGAASVSVAGLAGFGLAVFGITRAIKPFTLELSTAWDALTKYEEQVVKSGRGSEEAKDKLEDLRTTLKGMSPDAAKAFGAFAEARAEFRKETGALRKPFFDTVGEGLKTATALLPIFSRETTATGRVVASETQNWFKALRGSEAQGILEDLMSNFRRGLPGLFDGFGALGTLVGRVAQSASRFLPGLNQGFATWAENLARGAGEGQTLDQRMGRLIGHMQEFGHFAQSSGRLLVTFFGAGADEGANMLRSMTKTFDGWSDWMQSVEGQRSLDDFFSRSARLAGQLVPAFLNLGEAVGTLAEAAAPAAQVFAEVLKTGAELVAALPAGFLQVAGALGGVMFIARRMKGLMGGLGLGAILGLGTGTTAATGGVVAQGLKKVASGLGLTQIAGRAALGALGPAGAVFGAVTIGASLLSDAMDDSARDFKTQGEFAAKSQAALARLVPQTRQLTAATREARTAQATYNDQVDRFGPRSTKALVALRQLQVAEHSRARTQRSIAATSQIAVNQAMEAGNIAGSHYRSTMGSLDQPFTALVRSQAEASGQLRQFDSLMAGTRGTVGEVVGVAKHLGITWDRNAQSAWAVTNATRNQNQALNQQVGAAINAGRAAAQSGQLSRKGQQEVARFVQTFRKIPNAKRTAIQVQDAGVTGKIAKVSNNLTQLGRKKAVAKILADTKDPDRQLARLQALMARVDAKRSTAKVKGDVDLKPFSALNKALADAERQRRANVIVDVNTDPFTAGVSSAVTAANQQEVIIPVRGVKSGFWGPSGATGGTFPSFASGGMPNQLDLDRAAARAGKQPMARAAPGQEITRPTLLTGEIGGDTEWVITDNPNWRKSNTGHLSDAAAALGYQLLPTAGKGKGGNKKKKAPKPGASEVNTSGMDALEDELARAQQEYDLDRRDYDRGVLTGGGLIGASGKDDLLADLRWQIGIYQRMLPVAQNLIDLKPRKPRQAPKAIKRGAAKGKKGPSQVLEGYQKQQSAVQSYNSDLKSVKEDQGDQKRDIPYLIRALEIEMDEIEHGDQANLAAQAFSFDTARQDLYRSFASNIGGLPRASVTMPPGGPLGGFQTTHPNVALNGPATTPPAPTATAADARSGSGTIINQTNNFSAPPPDPHTWTQGTMFELGAAAP